MIRPAIGTLAFALVLIGCRPSPAPRTLPNDAYVWQRNWTPAVPAAMRESRGRVREFCVLWREMTFTANGVEMTAVAPDLPALTPEIRHASFAIRIPFAAGGLTADGARVAAVAREIAAIRQRADAAGLRVEGIQIDYDCPTRRLHDYAKFFAALKRAAPRARITPTVLPTWLGAPGWPALARAGDGFVLQLHEIGVLLDAKPNQLLCRPEDARKAIERAARQRVPFRAALPTYASSAFYDADGKILAIISEGPNQPPPAARRVEFKAPPAAMADLAAALRQDHPAELTGLIWYRLPIAADRRNWPLATFLAVLDKQPLAPEISWKLEALPNGARAVVVENRGTLSGPLPDRIEFSRDGRNVVASDALPPYEAEMQAGTLAFIKRAGAATSLSPGSRRSVGWLRFGSEPR